MGEPVYRRVLLKISGEALAGGKHFGLDFQVIGEVCDAIKEAVAMGVQVGVVIGGGNFWRGLKDGNGRMERVRAAEVNADVILLAKNIDGVYSADPNKDASAVKYDSITYDEVLAKHLAVMDSTATSLSMDNHIPVLVFALKDRENIIRALKGEKIGTIVKED